MSLLTYEARLLDEKCRIFAKVFQRSALMGYDSPRFIEQLMTNPVYEDLIIIDERQEWCDECFLLRCFENLEPFAGGQDRYEEFDLWFMGYLYKYWIRSRQMVPSEVYRILPAEVFYDRLGFYHTQGWEYIIRDASASLACS